FQIFLSREAAVLKKLNEFVRRIVIQNSTPDWLPFAPGSSFWVPPHQNTAAKIANLVDQVTHPLTEEEVLSLSSPSGWPCSSFFTPPPGFKKLNEFVRRIVIQNSTPDWLPFAPGSSFWVHPHQNTAAKIANLVDQVMHPLTEEEVLSLSSPSGWPCSSFFTPPPDQVAVKILSEESAQGYKEFRAEVEILMRVHHKNLTSLFGYCNEGNGMVLIYEYMANGNLGDYLSGKMSFILSWEERLKISLDAAQGLEYLHYGCKPPIVHRDVKPTNILLNEKIQAKIADFGLSRSFPVEGSDQISTVVAGTIGYLDPDYVITRGQRIALKRRRQKRLLREEDKRRSWRQDRLSMSCVSCKEEAIVTLYLNRYKGRFMGAFSQPIRSQPSL
ncbi:hypothetical protein F2Q69_00054931, partial [Brassica cretica]